MHLELKGGLEQSTPTGSPGVGGRWEGPASGAGLGRQLLELGPNTLHPRPVLGLSAGLQTENCHSRGIAHLSKPLVSPRFPPGLLNRSNQDLRSGSSDLPSFLQISSVQSKREPQGDTLIWTEDRGSGPAPRQSPVASPGSGTRCRRPAPADPPPFPCLRRPTARRAQRSPGFLWTAPWGRRSCRWARRMQPSDSRPTPWLQQRAESRQRRGLRGVLELNGPAAASHMQRKREPEPAPPSGQAPPCAPRSPLSGEPWLPCAGRRQLHPGRKMPGQRQLPPPGTKATPLRGLARLAEPGAGLGARFLRRPASARTPDFSTREAWRSALERRTATPGMQRSGCRELGWCHGVCQRQEAASERVHFRIIF